MNVSIDKWLKEAKNSKNASKIGIWLMHNGVVRSTPKAQVRPGIKDSSNGKAVSGMEFSFDKALLEEVLEKGRKLNGVYYLRAELSEGTLKAGDDIMFVLIGADTRDHAVSALNTVVGEIKSACVKEIELY